MKKTLDVVKETLINPKKPPHTGQRGLAGEPYQSRSAQHKAGRQKRTPGMYAEEATKKVREKLKRKNGKTDTGQPADPINLEPVKNDILASK